MAKRKIKKQEITEAVSIAAHQLKTPISIIKGYLEALISGDRGKITPPQEEYLSDALENVKKMSVFIENFLDVSRIEEKRFEMNFRSVSLEELVSQVLINLSTWVQANNCEIKLNVEKELPDVSTDPAKIRHVVENIITNAVKYKPVRGKIEITLKKGGSRVVFSCKDNGIGIPEKDYKKVFSKFYRSERALELDSSGSGLGLYINKAIVELSGGKIWFEKNKGPGMTFYFSLPVAASRKKIKLQF